jgi:hypothetical protein
LKQQSFPDVSGRSSGDLLHLSRRSLTSFKRRLSEEFEESLPVLAKIAFNFFRIFLHT